MTMQELIEKVNKWFEDRNLIKGSTDKDQILKLVQELGELSDHACKGQDIRDDLGDMLVVMLNIMKRNDYTVEECLQIAYDDIKDKKIIELENAKKLMHDRAFSVGKQWWERRRILIYLIKFISIA